MGYSLLGVSSGDKTLRLMLDILLAIRLQKSPKNLLWLVFPDEICLVSSS